MALIDWDCPFCGAINGIEEVEFRAADQITCSECNTTVDMAPEPSAEASE